MKRPVLFVIFQAGPRADGGLQSITEVMSSLTEHRPIILTNKETELTALWRSRGFGVHLEPTPTIASFKHAPVSHLKSYAGYYRAVTRVLQSSGARVIHANDPLTFQLSLIPAKRAGARVVLNLRGTIDPARRAPAFKYRMLFAAADHVLFLSEDMVDRWRNVAANATRAYSVTFSIVDPVRFAPTPLDRGRTPIVLVPGVLSHTKGQFEFIKRAVPTLASAGAEVWFSGDFDPATNAYAKACAAAAEPHSNFVRFLGYRSDIPDLIREARVIAVPSRTEGLMRGMIEAMSCGRPVVSFDVCSARELIEHYAGGAGRVVGAGDYDGMADALREYCRDADRAAEDGEKGAATAARLFNPARVVSQYEAVYRKLDRTW